MPHFIGHKKTLQSKTEHHTSSPDLQTFIISKVTDFPSLLLTFSWSFKSSFIFVKLLSSSSSSSSSSPSSPSCSPLDLPALDKIWNQEKQSDQNLSECENTKHKEHFLLWWTRANQMKNSEWYLLSDWLRLLVIKKAAHLQKKNSVKTPKNKFQIHCFVFSQKSMNCTAVSLLKPIWMDFLVYTRNTPDLTFHAFNNQIIPRTLCTLRYIMWAILTP